MPHLAFLVRNDGVEFMTHLLGCHELEGYLEIKPGEGDWSTLILSADEPIEGDGNALDGQVVLAFNACDQRELNVSAREVENSEPGVVLLVEDPAHRFIRELTSYHGIDTRVRIEDGAEWIRFTRSDLHDDEMPQATRDLCPE